jgi:hypothetical protein
MTGDAQIKVTRMKRTLDTRRSLVSLGNLALYTSFTQARGVHNYRGQERRAQVYIVRGVTQGAVEGDRDLSGSGVNRSFAKLPELLRKVTSRAWERELIVLFVTTRLPR